MTEQVFSLDWPHGYVDPRGRPARLICKDAKGAFPLIFLIQVDDLEFPYKSHEDGTNSFGDQVIRNAPEPKKKYTGWTNCYGSAVAKDSFVMYTYDTREEADRHARPGRVACIEVSFHKGDGL